MQMFIVPLACLAVLADARAFWTHRGDHNVGQWHGEGTLEQTWHENKVESYKKVATSFQTHGHGHTTIVGPSLHGSVIGPKDHGVSIVKPSSHATVLSANHGHANIVGSSSHATVIGHEDHGIPIVKPSLHGTVLSAKHHEVSLPAISYTSQIIHHPIPEKHVLPVAKTLKYSDNGQWHGERLLESQWHGDHDFHHRTLASSVKTHGLGHAAVVAPTSHGVVVVGSSDHGTVLVAPSDHGSVVSKNSFKTSLVATSHTAQVIQHPVHIPSEHGAVLVAPSAHGSVVSKNSHKSPLIVTSHTSQIIQHPVHIPRVSHIPHALPLVQSHGNKVSVIGSSDKIKSHSYRH